MAKPYRASRAKGTGFAPACARSARRNDARLIGDHGTGVDLDEIVRRRHLANLDHGRGRRRRLEVFAPHFVDRIEVLHVAHVDVDPADVVHAAAGFLDRRLEVLADLPRLRFDITDARDAAVGPPRGHAGDEHQPAARLDHGGVGKVAGRLADLRRGNLLLRHALSSRAAHEARLLISTRTLRYCQLLQLSSSWGIPGSRQITSPGFSCVCRTRPSSKVISFLPSVSGTIRYGSRCWCHGWRWPGSSITLHTRTCSFSNRILSPIGPSLRVVAVSVAMID